jgi:hypothetical protein
MQFVSSKKVEQSNGSTLFSGLSFGLCGDMFCNHSEIEEMIEIIAESLKTQFQIVIFWFQMKCLIK